MDRREILQNDASVVFMILVWFLFTVAVLSVGARLGTKYGMVRQLARDDWIMMVAQIMYLVQCISISIGAAQTLGKPISDLDEGAIQRFLMAEYFSFVFQLCALALIKDSISAYIRQLSPCTTHNRLNCALRVIVGLWLISSVVIFLFQCGLPAPWDYLHGPQCIDRRAWWTYVTIVNIATEFFIIGLYFYIIKNLCISLDRRIGVFLIFSARILVVCIALVQLTIFLAVFPSADVTMDLWLPTVLNQAVLAASVVTACGPYLRPFMESLESGMNRVENMTGGGGGGGGGSQEELSYARGSEYINPRFRGINYNDFSCNASMRGCSSPVQDI